MHEPIRRIYSAAPADVLDARGLHEQTLPPAIRALEDGGGVVPAGIAESVFAEAEAKAETENLRDAVRAGATPLEAYERSALSERAISSFPEPPPAWTPPEPG